MADTPIYKLVNRKWKELPTKGGSVSITDPQLKVGYVGDLTKLTVIQLEELLARQDNLLNNKKFVSNLKDKGKQLRDRREEIHDALQMVKNNTFPPEDINPGSFSSYEWNGKLDGNKEVNEEVPRTDNENVLGLIVDHDRDVPIVKDAVIESGDAADPSEIIVRELQQLELRDNEAEGTFDNNDEEKQDFGSKTLKYLEKKDKYVKTKRKPFKPFKAKNEWLPKNITERNKYLWQESSATGYTGVTNNNKIQLLPLNESLNLLRKHQAKEKERMRHEAVSHLSRIKGVNLASDKSYCGTSSFSSYRDTNTQKHILEDTDDEEDDDIHGNLKLVRVDEID